MDPGSAWIPIDFGWLGPDSGEQDDPQKQKKVKKFPVLSSGRSLLWAEGFSCSLEVLHGGLPGDKNNLNVIQKYDFFLSKNAGSGFGLKPVRMHNTILTERRISRERELN